MERDGLGGFEMLVLALGGLAVGVLGSVWLGCAVAVLVAGGGPAPHLGDAAVAVGALPNHLTSPRDAWPPTSRSGVPGPFVYWPATVAAMAAVLAAVGLVVRTLMRSNVGTARRSPLGVDARPGFGTARDLRPLLVDGPVPGRFILGRFGRRLIATEAPPPRAGGSAWVKPRRPAAHVGDRGAVALIGPSRSGKTTAAVAGILEWDGPAVLSSVKADLLASTLGWRSGAGEVRVYDPTRTTADSSARWSPLRDAGTLLGAQRSARALCDAAPKSGVDGGLDFWLAQAEILLSGLLFAAHHSQRDMGSVCRWVLEQERSDKKGRGEVLGSLERLLMSERVSDHVEAKDVERLLRAVWSMDQRTQSSVYATAQTVVWPWANPQVAASSKADRSISLDWLIGDSNTLYLCAPIEDQRRLAPAFGGLLNDLIGQVYRHVAATGQPLDPPLLVVIDEAGNTPLRALPEYASTLAGLGVLLVTIWQSLAQIEAAYQRQADTILTNHLSKVFYAGLSDPASLRYVASVLGDAEVDTQSRTTGETSRSRSNQHSTTRVALAPPHALRQMRPGDALLVHGTLPPAHIRTRPWWKERRLRERAEAKPVEAGEDR
ncbi:type IV secretory system conjugative DNA transfer family protein [Aquihabitans sp. G128]|uniref:type IV secretory system conjugative DNA transfer family protein n=1 Tax=Aquihabitans sp. G128 TaxID=2849779 RepID=UPI001C23B1F8|nr:type IV secretory system conjugative DNA transfer family protein [Aquihabitans sp. G128]QXC60616.1 type IV secretory system conjugative DNA transfer family protein [Aquihabitans sp. G128]